jgi:hypothetical protein
MSKVTLVILIWPVASLFLAVRYSEAIGAARRVQLDDYLAIRRKAWRRGLS